MDFTLENLKTFSWLSFVVEYQNKTLIALIKIQFRNWRHL